LYLKRDAALKGSGETGAKKQHDKGKMTARERIDYLFDKGTFTETGMYVEATCTEFGMDEKRFAGDGVITGYGEINSRPVAAMSQDFTFLGGALGEKNAEKVVKIMDFAAMHGIPFVALNDSGGARIQEGVNSLKGYGDIFKLNVRYSGVIPQISAIMGPCAGGASYSPAITDFIFMVDKSSYMCITGTKVIKKVTGEDVDIEQLGGAGLHNQKSGVAHFKCTSDKECLDSIKVLLSYLPDSNRENPPTIPKGNVQPPKRFTLEGIIPDATNKPYDMKQVIENVFDKKSFFEVQPHFASNIITGFSRLDGKIVGVVANQPMFMAGCLDINASDKGARFVRFCDSFNIPLISFTDVPGYMPGVEQEHGGIIRHGAKLLYAFAEATVEKINVILRKAYGGAYVSMNSIHLGADFVFAWPKAEIAVMGAEGATDIIFSKQIRSSENPVKTKKELMEGYKEKLFNPYAAAMLGYITDVIFPNETRYKLINAIEMASRKRESLPQKKHGNIPL
jgi:acetyl-CoA carboxylase carboxyltransferase component